MKKTMAIVIGAWLLGCVGTGCAAGAVHLRRGAWSGELALHGDLTSAEYAAQRAMLDHCGGRSRVLSAGEAERAEIADPDGLVHEISADASGRRVQYVCVSRAPEAFRGPRATVTVTSTTGTRGGS